MTKLGNMLRNYRQEHPDKLLAWKAHEKIRENALQQTVKTTSEQRKYIIIKLKQANPDITLQAIGDKVGCTREYVRVVLKKFGISTYRPPMENKSCLECQKPISRHRAYRTEICKECTFSNRRAETICPNCQKVNLSLKSHIKRNTNTFCNNQCQFSYMGKTYGFKAHPENAVHGLGYKPHNSTAWFINWDQAKRRKQH